MKNVLHIANYAAAYRGNFIESLENLSQELQKRNVRSYYIFPNTANCPWVSELIEQGKVVYLLSDETRNDAKCIHRIIQEKNIEIVHTHFISIKTFIAVMSGSRRTDVKLIMHFHNHSAKSSFYKNFLRRLIYRKCTMIACSQSVYESIARDYPKNEKYRVDNGIYFKRLETKERISRDGYNLLAGTKICLIFGFDFYRKGVDLALRALEKLNSFEVRYELIIALSTNFLYVEQETKRVLGGIPSWVHIIKARSDVATLYNLCDIFLSPSREEGLPYSLLEAAYCHCNVVYSDISAQNNLIVPYGKMHQENNYLSLAEAIEEVGKMGNVKMENYESATAILKNNYSVEKWTKEIIEIYEKSGLFTS